MKRHERSRALLEWVHVGTTYCYIKLDLLLLLFNTLGRFQVFGMSLPIGKAVESGFNITNPRRTQSLNILR